MTYKATPGLDRIPPNRRYSVYRATHRRLMLENEGYRKRYNQYIGSAIVAVTGPGAVWLGNTAIGITASILFSLVPAAGIIYLACRQQKYMNQCIGHILQGQSH